MNIKEIVNRGNGTDITTQEQIFVVKKYIKEKKNIDVDINIRRTMPIDFIDFDIILKRDLQLLNIAYFTAEAFFKNKYNEKRKR